MKIKVENAYSDGHESAIVYDDVPEYVGEDPRDDDWDFWMHVQPYTGDGHGGEDPDLGWFYGVTVLDASDPDLIGFHVENSGS